MMMVVVGGDIIIGDAGERILEEEMHQNIQKKHINTSRTKCTRHMVDMTAKNVAKAKEEPNMDVLYHLSSAGWFHMGYNSVVSLLQDGKMT